MKIPLVGSNMPEFWVFNEGRKRECRLGALEGDAAMAGVSKVFPERSVQEAVAITAAQVTRAGNSHADADGIVKRVGAGE
jgi:hypothetical protein